MRDRAAVKCSGQLTRQREHGGRGRIRTSVARKERQIYSLLVLATHPPVLEKFRRQIAVAGTKNFGKIPALRAKTQNGLVSRDTSPSILSSRIRSVSLPAKFLVELAEGIEPPTL
jgi:hypothetical protein